ncbi:TPA: hypothetical protein ACKP5W_003792 [Pseudomonas aeruginosa]
MNLLPIDDSPLQEQRFEFAGQRLRLTLRYNSVGDHWGLDLFDELSQAWIAQGLALVVGVPMLWRSSVPYYFWLTDESGAGLDPIGGQDLGSRCRLYIGEKSEVAP